MKLVAGIIGLLALVVFILYHRIQLDEDWIQSISNELKELKNDKSSITDSEGSERD
jgi:Na+/melibiose symporter-like transporter